IDLNVTCRYAGVFHVEKNGRYSISRTEAADLCKAFDCTLPTMAQMEEAWRAGFETCRYGFIEGHVVIPRIHPNPICAANHTGVYILTSNTSQYDTYCYNASAPQGEDCTAITNLTNAFEGEVSIRFVLRTGWKPTEENEDERDKHPIHSGSGIDDDEDFISSTTQNSNMNKFYFYFFVNLHPPSIPCVYVKKSNYNNDLIPSDMDSSHSTTLQPSEDSNTHLVEDWDRTEPLPMTTQQSHTQSFSTSHGGFEEDKDQPMMSTPTPSNRHDGGGGHLPEDSATSVGGYTPHSPDTKEYTTLIPVTPANTESPGVTEVTVDGDSNVNVDGPLPEDGDSSSDPRDHTTQRSGPTGHSSGSREGEANTTSGPIRKPQIPEWLIILASLLALALILAVCIAVNSRRRCGQKKKLVINGNGAVEDRKPSGLNGEASKSQEMVHLVNKEPSETPDQCMTADETRNLQNVDMKIGV
uniref:CD44 antigen n=1 Tax=Myotis lucifugus TaxID=59463 RepID=G1PF20_MYOLU